MPNVADGDKIEDDYVLLEVTPGNIDSLMSTTPIEQESRKREIYFFFLCNPGGFRSKPGKDYEINLSKGCYYRSTPLLEYRKVLKHQEVWELLPHPMDGERADRLINLDEAFSFKRHVKDVEKVYMVNLNYAEETTTLWHYAVTMEQKADEKFKPKIFEKTIPVLKKDLKTGIEHREKLIDRLDNWILMS